MGKINILIVDDHSIVREGIKSTLKTNNKLFLCTEAEDGLDAIEKLKQKTPDIIILDLSIPGISGIELIKFINLNFPRIKTIILTMHDEPEYVVSALQQGVKGYLLKSSDLAELKKAVLDIYAGRNFYSKRLANIMALALKTKGETTLRSLKESLTEREKQVLSSIVQGTSNKITAETLRISIKTVSVHRTNIMKKLNASNTADLVRIAIENKLV